jgi:NAD(P)-dependent dehydrogenase (short-subunit alcohol dehydrogenase family)
MSSYASAFYAFLEKNPYLSSALSGLAIIVVGGKVISSRSLRSRRLPPKDERVLVIGATSGVGRNIAVLCARRGARVCVVGRRKALLDELQLELNTTSTANNSSGQKSLGVAADMTRPEDLVAVRETLEKGGLFAKSDWLLFSLILVHIEWQGVDTIYICAGVSALRPLLEVADSPHGKQETTLEGIKKTGEIAQKAIDGNFTGPLLAAITFVSHLILHPM